jgi:hypothetical protein
VTTGNPATAAMRRTKDEVATAYRATFGHPLARTVLADLFAEAGLFKENTAAAHLATANPVAVGVSEGKRRLALRIVGMTIGADHACTELAALVAAAAAVPPPLNAGPRPAITEETPETSH